MFIDEHARASVVDRYLIKVVCTAKFGNFENKLAKGTRLIVLAFNVALHDPCIGKVSPDDRGGGARRLKKYLVLNPFAQIIRFHQGETLILLVE